MNVTKISETATKITLGWTPVPGAIGYRFQSSSQAPKWSHTWDATRDQVVFAKADWYKIEALGVADAGEYPLPGYTDAASVDTSRDPIPPQSSTVIDLSSPLTVSTAISDVTYNVTAAMPNNAILLTPTGSLTRCVIKCNKLSPNGVGAGTVADVSTFDATNRGFNNVEHFFGANRDTGSKVGFSLKGSGVTLAADAMLKAVDFDRFGFYVDSLLDSLLDGALVALDGGKTTRNPSATGVEFWTNVQRTHINIIISNANPGYGLAIYGGSGFNTINEFYGDAFEAFDSDPGISIGGGSHDNHIGKATVKNYVIGAIMGEDVDPSVYNNTIDSILVEGARYPGVIMDRGAYDNTVSSAVLTNTASPLPYKGSVHIGNRGAQTNPPPHGNKVLGLVQSGMARVPAYAVYLGAGTNANEVSGEAHSWATAMVLDEGTGNLVTL